MVTFAGLRHQWRTRSQKAMTSLSERHAVLDFRR
jgi:hypothetical protein